jgi:hypothetical protein
MESRYWISAAVTKPCRCRWPAPELRSSVSPTSSLREVLPGSAERREDCDLRQAVPAGSGPFRQQRLAALRASAENRRGGHRDRWALRGGAGRPPVPHAHLPRSAAVCHGKRRASRDSVTERNRRAPISANGRSHGARKAPPILGEPTCRHPRRRSTTSPQAGSCGARRRRSARAAACAPPRGRPGRTRAGTPPRWWTPSRGRAPSVPRRRRPPGRSASTRYRQVEVSVERAEAFFTGSLPLLPETVLETHLAAHPPALTVG